MTDSRIRPRERDAIVQSLRAGVVPRSGHQHIQVGRADEVLALVSDIQRIADGGSAVRFVIGEYGSGKTFFLQLVRAIALEKRLVTMHADLGPDRRLHATGGQARSLYAELTRNLATRSKPEGGALASIVERFVSQALAEARTSGGTPTTVIHDRLSQLSEMTGKYDFAEVVAAYWTGHDTGNEQLKSDAVRWLRGEFATRTDARRALGVRTIVDDANVYDQLKLLARFVRHAGYEGVLVGLDEMVNLYKLANTQARNSNYEQILRVLNDCLQGSAAHLGFIFGGTPEFLLDTRRGLYSYAALQSRLAENSFASNGLVDHSGPVLRLANLSPEDFYVLLTKLRHVYAAGDPAAYLLPEQGIEAFMQHCSSRIGDAYFRTPRNTITEFINLLAILDQNPGADWRRLVGEVSIPQDVNPDLLPLEGEPLEQKQEASTDSSPGFQGHTAEPDRPHQDGSLATFRL
ncbi:ATP-binding protein [Actinospica sp. MGRD01-02]|uniref:ATP-binding protein n=1 Tax=Actinospica acidithermotolerans TaxID=2828514 RepID=A0A941IN98_9ACTN|nr:ATP-binding protein [Actinospica acidithermotolerans]MBR7829301.1 ATP-binding protein [Actinospica acidithermotolerans]